MKAATCEGRAMSGSQDATIQEWDLETGALEATLRGHSETIYSLARGRAVQRVVGRDDQGLDYGDMGGAADGGGIRDCGGIRDGCWCLTMSWSKLVSGSADRGTGWGHEVRGAGVGR